MLLPRPIHLFAVVALIFHPSALSDDPSCPSSDSAAPSSPKPPPAPKLVFILAGQSNMAGRGGVSNGTWDGVVPPECRPVPSIQRMTAGLQWEAAREPLHADIDVNKICGVGLGMPFAHSIRSSSKGSAPAPEVGLVPCAIGGTKIDQWGKGTQLYEMMVQRARAAGAGWVVGALLWYQGESDTVWQVDTDAYRAKMERMTCDLRADLGLPDLLVIQVLLASWEGPFVDAVRKAQKGVRLPNVVWVDAKGLALQTDHLHLTTSAQVELGKKLSAAYLRHAKTCYPRA